MTLEETDDFKQVYFDAMEEFWDHAIARIMNISDSLESLFVAIQKNERKIVGDQVSQIISQLLESHTAQKSYWAMRERLLMSEDLENETSFKEK